MINSKWSAIVYSATFSVDYRFLAIPQDFNSENDENKKWLEKYVTVTTSVPESLRKKPRWSLFRNEDFCVVGVTCMLKNLVKCSNSENPLLIKTKDFQNREIYGFWGYITQIKDNEVIPIPKMNLQLFHDLHIYVKDKWLAKEYNKRTEITEYNKEFSHDDLVIVNQVCNLKNGGLNYKDNKVNLWSVSENEALWSEIANSKDSISLCLNLAREIDAIKSDFSNATALDIREFCERERIKKEVEDIYSQRNSLPSVETLTTNSGTLEEREKYDQEIGSDYSNNILIQKPQSLRRNPEEFIKQEFQELGNVVNSALLFMSEKIVLNEKKDTETNSDPTLKKSDEKQDREIYGFQPRENKQEGDDEREKPSQDKPKDWF